MREDAATKGLRYLTEGRLTIAWLDGRKIEAVCLGDSAENYRLGYDRGAWWCECPARGRCAHLTALMRVTLVPRSRRVVA
jgi:uncharacterized Zn finger protein